MYNTMRIPASITAFSLALASNLGAQEAEDPQRVTLLGLRHIAAHAKVQVARQATLDPVDDAVLRTRLEQALRQEGIVVQEHKDVRDGSAGQISLVYTVISMADASGRETRFAASSCLHASQYVRIPRLERGGRVAYTVAPTWSSCGIVAGSTDSYRNAILLNADEQIARFLEAWRSVNPRGSAAPRILSSE
ncbi:MAG TPA: hypothetical protein VHK28_06500 [Candidatus Limnocylindria bacterium]|nr:hypothetical protein [Candidatus Limnocylindria bacterium]